MGYLIETKNGNYDIPDNNIELYYGVQNFNADGYYFNYCIMVCYEKKMRCVFSHLNEINKIIYNNNGEVVEFKNLKRIGGLSHSGVVGYSDIIGKEKLKTLLRKNNLNYILKSYFRDRYEDLYNSIESNLLKKIDLKYQISLNVYLLLEK